MENKIEFILKKFDKTLCFQITKQNGFYFGSKYSTKTKRIIIDDYTIYIEKSMRPDINLYHYKDMCEIYIYLRGGNTNNDLNISKMRFISNEERDKVYDLIIRSFHEISKL